MLTDVLAYVWVWVILELLRNSKEEKVKTQNEKLFGAFFKNEKLFGASYFKNKKLFGAEVGEAKPVCEKLSEKSRNNPPVENNFKNFQTNQSPPNK